MNRLSQHHDWLALVEISGPFLAVPVLDEAFPQGLEELDGIKRKRLRQAYEEWREALETDDPQFNELHAAWIDEVLARGLELDEDGKSDVLKRTDWCAANLNVSLPEHGVTLSPDLAVINEQRADKPLMLIQTYGQDVDLYATLKLDGWAVTPADRMVQLCRAIGCRLGLVTNGERWMLVDAPVGAVTTFASWYARIWGQGPITLQAFVHLLGIRRFFVDEAEQLPALLDRSLKYQNEVTDALGEQVRRAVEVLIQALDKADQDRDRELLCDVKEPELYEAALTVMMRLVFLLSAEERGLLLLGDERYEANYALSTLRMQLRTEFEETLERRWDAWSRLLAIFRAVFGGIEHENLRLPALGGSLFDPDRFPFLEGRAQGSNWCTDVAKPLPIDNRTVLLLLEAIQQFQGRTLSYRALDVEQIGYVYEGLLERTVKRTPEVTLELDATKSAQSPWVTLAELESARLAGAEPLAELLQQRSGSSASRVRNDLARPVDDVLADRVLTACHGDTALRDRIKPFGRLVRTDPWGYPLVYPAGAFIVTTGSDRRETGTHYTPKSLTEAIVAETLTPIVYVGPAEGKPRAAWVLKSSAELLGMKICDPAMGSGAFLVQACRWLADRLVEAWAQAEAQGHAVGVDGRVADADANVEALPRDTEALPRDTEARTIVARRLIAERCLYGVDLNPLAVELAKLSIWLVTLAKGRPFGFLDHNLRCGDSLLGIHRLDQLTQLSMNPTGQRQLRLFGQNIEQAVSEALELRSRLREMPIRDTHDVETMAHLDADARYRLEVPESIADAFIGEVFVIGGNASGLENALGTLAIQAGHAVDGDREAIEAIVDRARSTLSVDLLAGRASRHSFHWPLEFPEVFQKGGFDGLIGNPPYLGGPKLTGTFGTTYRDYLVEFVANGARGLADLCAYFLLRAANLLSVRGQFGLVVTSAIAEGDTRAVGLEQLVGRGWSIVRATGRARWLGSASVTYSLIWMCPATWNGKCFLNGTPVSGITPMLTEKQNVSGQPKRLKANQSKSFNGVKVYGNGFVISKEEAHALIFKDARNGSVLFPYITTKDINSHPNHEASAWAIRFFDWPLNRESAPTDYDGPVATDFPDCLAIVEDRVKPERTRLNEHGKYVVREPMPQLWWIYGEKRPGLYAAISQLDHVLAVGAQATKYATFAVLDKEMVFSHSLSIIADGSFGTYAVLNSSLHEAWARHYGGYNLALLRYSPTDLFETFPFPSSVLPLELIGHSFHHLLRSVMLAWQEGLTDTYNRFHNPNERSTDIVSLRNMQIEMDTSVIAAYGWSDVRLDHSFHETSQGMRFTIGESARLLTLDRLLDLNHRRYAEEVAHGLDGSPTKRRITRAKRPRAATTQQQGLDFGHAPATRNTAFHPDASSVILDHLRSQFGWHAKNDILAATGIPDSQWKLAIDDLIVCGEVERRGEKRGVTYRAMTRSRSV